MWSRPFAPMSLEVSKDHATLRNTAELRGRVRRNEATPQEPRSLGADERGRGAARRRGVLKCDDDATVVQRWRRAADLPHLLLDELRLACPAGTIGA
jgi:hypothetical protein